MQKNRFIICIFLAWICLPIWPSSVTQKPIFSKELFRHIFPGSALELSRARFIPVGLAPRASAHGMQTFMKHRALERGQRAAYAHVEQQFKNADDFFNRFFSPQDIQHINKIFLQTYNDDGIDPQKFGSFRSEPVFIPRKPLMLLQRVGHAVQAVIPEPPFELLHNDKKNTEQFLKYIEQNSTPSWTLLNGVAMPNWKYIRTAAAAELARDQKWTEQHIHIFPPHQAKDLINATLATEKVLGKNVQASKIVDVHQIPKKFEYMLGQLLSDCKKKLATARKDQKKIIEIAAAFHVGILRLHPFLGANTRTALVVTNAILRFAGLPAIWFDDGDAYHRAVFEDLTTTSKNANFYALLQHAIHQRAADISALH